MVRWSVRRASFWAMVVPFVGLAGVSLWVLSLARGEYAGAPPPAFGQQWWFMSLLLGILPFAGLLSSVRYSSVRHPPEVANVAPMREASFVQYRVRAVLAMVATGSVGFSALAAAAAWYVFAVDPWSLSVRLAFVLLPAAGFWTFAGIVGSGAFGRLSDSVQGVIVVAAILLALAGLPSLVTLDLRGVAGDPLVLLWRGLCLPGTKLVTGTPLDAADLLVLGSAWVAFAGVAVLARGFPYRAPEPAWSPATEPLSRERAPPYEFVQRLRARLRVSYLDLGQGTSALVGRNLTLSLRGFALFIQGMLVMMLVMFIPMSGALQEAPESSLFFSMMPGLFVSLMLPMFVSSPLMEGRGLLLVRLAPLRPAQAFAGYAGTAMLLVAIWSAVIGGIALAAGAPFGHAALAFLYILSAGAVSATWAFLAASLPVPRGMASVSPQAVGAAASMWMLPAMFLLMTELLVVLLAFEGILVMTATLVALNLGVAALVTIAGLAAFRVPPKV